jgi:putative membrane protein
MYRGFNGSWAQGGFAYGFPWMSLVMGIIVVALISFSIYSIVRMRRTNKNSIPESKVHGMDILIDRYARGEIDAEKFREMKDVLEAKSGNLS